MMFSCSLAPTFDPAAKLTTIPLSVSLLQLWILQRVPHETFVICSSSIVGDLFAHCDLRDHLPELLTRLDVRDHLFQDADSSRCSGNS